jgi:hypothetical protein
MDKIVGMCADEVPSMTELQYDIKTRIKHVIIHTTFTHIGAFIDML